MSPTRAETESRVARRIRKSLGDGTLSLADFELGHIPEQVSKLSDLKELNVSGNRLTQIPPFIAELKNLRFLNVSRNHIRSLPSGLATLEKLRVLSVSHNRGLRLPEWLGKLERLRTISLGGIELAEFPSFIRSLRNLETLFVDGNYLRALPEWISEIDLLDTLDVSDNVLTALPRSLLLITGLRTLNIERNPLLLLPPEIEQSHDAARILDYYFRTAMDAERQPLNEFKLILVGRGGVGKTSLVHKLLTDDYKEFKRTPGINITKWSNRIDGEEVRAHIWDFGGQEIMHGLHRFFMTERALYVILISGREGTEDHDAEYWLSMVRSFAGDAPVIVLLHKWSDYRFELNRALLRDKYGRDLVFVETDSETGEGIAPLRERLRALAKTLPGLKAAWPAEWRRIKDELPSKKENWLTFEEFRAYCKEFDINEARDQEALAASLHDLGLMLSYRNDETLRHFGVLNPRWVTTGIYQLLNAPALREAGGQFTLESFRQVLPKNTYPAELHPYLLALMRRFQLCHPLDDKGIEYLIPELLTKEEEPNIDEQFPPDECLGFNYNYDAVLPEGLLPRFIVATYVHRKPGLVWRSGVILERANCRALVRGDVLGRRVMIRVTGAGGSRRELLGIIREHFERIHKTYEKLPVTEIVPVPGHSAAHVKHELLLKYERDGRDKIAIEVGDGLLDVKIKELLDGIDLPGKRRLSAESDPLRQDAALPVFVSYAREDSTLHDQLRAALVPFERVGKLRIWSDMLTVAGEKWEEQIVANLDRAKIVILLLSNDFLASSYCVEVELPRVMKRHEDGECMIVPIVVRACQYVMLPIGKIQAIVPEGKPVNENKKRDRAWLEVTKELDRVIAHRKQPH